MDKLLVSAVGITVIGIIYWFFFGKKSSFAEASEGHGTIEIIVDGGYKPNIIKIPQGKSVILTFIRKDSNTCLEELYIPDYKIKKYLPINTPVIVTLPLPHPASSGFHCGMNMFHGKIEVL
ncbi:cupredoxin domain-containing protein [Candidatus Gottesmanbacteria bacterium]|nr:cupredoxin domain-containing protein [Candidatus Gottesmanbacteria bacterium]